jgi:hypothetical protein
MTFEISQYDCDERLCSSAELPSSGALRAHLAELVDESVVDVDRLATEFAGEAPLAGSRGTVRFGPLA